MKKYINNKEIDLLLKISGKTEERNTHMKDKEEHKNSNAQDDFRHKYDILKYIMGTHEAAAEWDLTYTRVGVLCNEGEINAKLFGKAWIIPKLQPKRRGFKKNDENVIKDVEDLIEFMEIMQKYPKVSGMFNHILQDYKDINEENARLKSLIEMKEGHVFNETVR
ncbi:hypothetical protein LJR153_007356 [Paenibacillus sp. LjRoot153]|uniref:hypothetical protein n=1 Tax=Paenibacillus sp. LjRoot153 TaxID=3342270 RepID=UPI003ECC2941